MESVIAISTFFALHDSYVKSPLKSSSSTFGIVIVLISIWSMVTGPPMLEAISEFGIITRDDTFLAWGQRGTGGGQLPHFLSVLGILMLVIGSTTLELVIVAFPGFEALVFLKFLLKIAPRSTLYLDDIYCFWLTKSNEFFLSSAICKSRSEIAGKSAL